MTPKQQKYAECRANGLRTKQAAIAAGYSPSGADVQAANLEARADVQALIRKLKHCGDKKSTKADPKSDETSPDVHERSNYLRDSYENPLDMFLHLLNEPRAPIGVRIQAAKDAAPYVHGKIAPPSGGGKKEKEKADAKVASKQGAFPTRSAPTRSMRVN